MDWNDIADRTEFLRTISMILSTAAITISLISLFLK